MGKNIESLLTCVHLKNNFVVLITHGKLLKGYGPSMVYVTDERSQTYYSLREIFGRTD